MTVVFMYGVPYVKPVLGEIKQGMPAYAAGLRKGDQILAVNGAKIENWADLSDAIKAGNGEQIKIDFARPAPNASPSTMSVLVKPRLEKEDTGYGNKTSVWIIGVLPRGDEGTKRYGPFKAVYQSVVSTVDLSGRLVMGIAQIFNGTTPARQALGGPIMIAKMAGKEAKRGFADVAGFTVMLSLELGIINLLPVPLLDGGHLFFFLIEGLRGKPLQLRHREFAMQIGLLLLVALMTFVIVNDISHIMQLSPHWRPALKPGQCWESTPAGPRADLALVAGGRVLAEGSHSVASHGAELPAAVAQVLATCGAFDSRAQARRSRNRSGLIHRAARGAQLRQGTQAGDRMRTFGHTESRHARPDGAGRNFRYAGGPAHLSGAGRS